MSGDNNSSSDKVISVTCGVSKEMLAKRLEESNYGANVQMFDQYFVFHSSTNTNGSTSHDESTTISAVSQHPICKECRQPIPAHSSSSSVSNGGEGGAVEQQQPSVATVGTVLGTSMETLSTHEFPDALLRDPEVNCDSIHTPIPKRAIRNMLIMMGLVAVLYLALVFTSPPNLQKKIFEQLFLAYILLGLFSVVVMYFMRGYSLHVNFHDKIVRVEDYWAGSVRCPRVQEFQLSDVIGVKFDGTLTRDVKEGQLMKVILQLAGGREVAVGSFGSVSALTNNDGNKWKSYVHLMKESA